MLLCKIIENATELETLGYNGYLKMQSLGYNCYLIFFLKNTEMKYFGSLWALVDLALEFWGIVCSLILNCDSGNHFIGAIISQVWLSVSHIITVNRLSLYLELPL